jgi:predicted amidohydrolase
VRVAACQLPDVLNDVARARALIEDWTAAAEERGAELVLFPECFLQGYDLRREHVEAVAIEVRSPAFARLRRALSALGPTIVFGLIERDGDELRNTAVAIARGEIVARYRKGHLIGNEASVFEPGNEHAVFEVAGVKVGLNICYDLQFAEPARAAAGAGAVMLACPCNNMLRRESAEEWRFRHNELRAQRARDSGLWLVSSDVTGERDGRISYGPTALIDPRGRVVDQLPLLTVGMLVADVPVAASTLS